MSIKAQGGVFGRNPTYNDLNAEDITTGNLTATGAISFPADSLSGDYIAGGDARLTVLQVDSDLSALSGIRIGGGSAEYSMDVYEDGTFTPNINGQDAGDGMYVRKGEEVTVWMHFRNVDLSLLTPGDTASFGGIPFTWDGGQARYWAGSVFHSSGVAISSYPMLFARGNSPGTFRVQDGNSFTTISDYTSGAFNLNLCCSFRLDF
jgi:hypothetical protein